MIDLFKVYVPEKLNIQLFEEILKSGKLNSGFYLKQLEQELISFLGNPYVMVTSNNNYASLIALALCDLKNDDEVIASPMACLASNQPVLNFGGKIVWADIDPSTGSLSPEDVKRKITSKTKVIIHYHWCGYPGYIDEINEIGFENGIKVIDDGIESFGSIYKGKMIGNNGTDLTTFSFQTVRLPNSVDGGAISFASKEMYEKALRIRDFGIDRKTFRDDLGEISKISDINHLGYNAIMNELNAYIGFQVIKDTRELIEKQRVNAKLWDSYFYGKESKPIGTRNEISPNYWVYSLLSNKMEQDLLRFREKGFYASKIHLRNDYYSSFGEFDSTLSGVNEFSSKQFSIPSGWWVNTINELAGV